MNCMIMSIGFELGYSAYNHNTLTMWEGQFGDFANTCQVIVMIHHVYKRYPLILL